MPKIEEGERRRLLTAARVGRLATVTADGRPHVVPCCFAVVEDAVYSAVDAKPKTTTALKRLDNIEATATASLVVDHFAEDWSQLWWVRVDGPTAIVESQVEAEQALDALAEKYEQYRAARPAGPILRITIDRWADWTASPR